APKPIIGLYAGLPSFPLCCYSSPLIDLIGVNRGKRPSLPSLPWGRWKTIRNYRKARKLGSWDCTPLSEDWEMTPVHAFGSDRGKVAMKAQNILIAQLLNLLSCQKGYALF